MSAPRKIGISMSAEPRGWKAGVGAARSNKWATREWESGRSRTFVDEQDHRAPAWRGKGRGEKKVYVNTTVTGGTGGGGRAKKK